MEEKKEYCCEKKECCCEKKLVDLKDKELENISGGDIGTSLYTWHCHKCNTPNNFGNYCKKCGASAK